MAKNRPELDLDFVNKKALIEMSIKWKYGSLKGFDVITKFKITEISRYYMLGYMYCDYCECFIKGDINICPFCGGRLKFTTRNRSKYEIIKYSEPRSDPFIFNEIDNGGK